MPHSHWPASGSRCGYGGNFLVCSIRVHPLEGLLVDWAWSGPGSGHMIPTSHYFTHGRTKVQPAVYKPSLLDTLSSSFSCTHFSPDSLHIFPSNYFGWYPLCPQGDLFSNLYTFVSRQLLADQSFHQKGRLLVAGRSCGFRNTTTIFSTWWSLQRYNLSSWIV